MLVWGVEALLLEGKSHVPFPSTQVHSNCFWVATKDVNGALCFPMATGGLGMVIPWELKPEPPPFPQKAPLGNLLEEQFPLRGWSGAMLAVGHPSHI